MAFIFSIGKFEIIKYPHLFCFYKSALVTIAPPFHPYYRNNGVSKVSNINWIQQGGYTTSIECELFNETQQNTVQNAINTTPDKDDTINDNAPPPCF